MFSINGPSGPTSRNERQVVTAAEILQREAMRKQEAKDAGESFFQVRTASKSTQSTAGGASSSTSKRSVAATRHKQHQRTAERPTADASEQDDANNSCSTDTSQIFKGCRIIFNGRTGNISSYNLAKLVQDHGGNVCSALTTTRITHMVGANLSGAKANKVLQKHGRVKVVSPDWILQSVKAAKRQPEFDFLLYKDTQQRRIC